MYPHLHPAIRQELSRHGIVHIPCAGIVNGNSCQVCKVHSVGSIWVRRRAGYELRCVGLQKSRNLTNSAPQIQSL